MNLFPAPTQTIAGTADALRKKRITCVAVLEECLAHVDAREQEIRAWVSVDRDGALRRACELDDSLARGNLAGPLHGIPVGIKDIIDVAGVPTQCGFAPYAGRIPAEDAIVVRRLREAGAVILGKTVTTQFASYDPPVTKNPWNVERTPGGSSSGSAAAVSAGMCLAALGSQTGGSITRPAAFCGIVGCKPTCGRVPLTGVYPLAPSLDHPGPFARNVRDLALLLDVLAGHDPSDPRSSREAAPDLLGAVDASSKPPRIGRLRGLFETDVEDPAIAALDDALGRFTDAGATVAETSLPESFAEVPVHHRAIMYSELAAVHDEQYQRLREHYAPGFASQIEEGFAIDSSKVEAARAHREALCAKLREIFERVDILACPAATGPAPTPETTGNPAMNIPWSYTGLPTITFPLTLAEGLPLGIQLVGPAFGEGRLFSAAAWCERAVSG